MLRTDSFKRKLKAYQSAQYCRTVVRATPLISVYIDRFNIASNCLYASFYLCYA